MSKGKTAAMRAAIEECADDKGTIRPETVWRAAQNPKSPLHHRFPWDLQKAAEMTWTNIARDLIREVRFMVTYEERKIVVPYYVSDPRVADSAYVQTMRVAKNKNLSEKVLREEIERIKNAVRRARTVAHVFNLTTKFESLLESVVEIESGL